MSAMAAYFAAQAGLQLLGAFQSARMRRRQAHLSQLQGQIQLEAAQFQARMTRKAGGEQATLIRRESRRGAGAATAKIATSGAEVGGSPLIALNDQIWQDERAAGITETNAEAGATALELRGRAAKASGDAEASRLRAEAGFTETAGWLGAFGTFAKYDFRSRRLTGKGLFEG